MESLFFPSASLLDLVQWTQPLHSKTNWLFVRLDSDRRIENVVDMLSTRMKQVSITFWRGPEGLWFSGTELQNEFVITRVLVPFSACYLFPHTVKQCAKPKFDATTDSGRAFTADEVSQITLEIKKLEALCFAADGCGLHCVVADPELKIALSVAQSNLNRDRTA